MKIDVEFLIVIMSSAAPDRAAGFNPVGLGHDGYSFKPGYSIFSTSPASTLSPGPVLYVL